MDSASDDLIRRLLLRIRELSDRPVTTYRTGIVTATAPLAVALGGSDVSYTDVKRLESYTPTLTDVVAVLTFGPDLLVLGKVV